MAKYATKEELTLIAKAYCEKISYFSSYSTVIICWMH